MKPDLHKTLSCIKLYFKICGSTLAPSNNIEDGAKTHKVTFTKDILFFPPLLCGLHFLQHILQKDGPRNLLEWPEKKISDLLHMDEITFCSCIVLVSFF